MENTGKTTVTAPPSAYFLRSERGVVGPVAPAVLRRWYADGRLGPRTPVSADGGKWHALENIPELSRFVSQYEFDDFRQALAYRLDGCRVRLRRLGGLFPVAVLAGSLAGLILAGALTVGVFLSLWPGFPWSPALCCALAPGGLIGAWTGHLAGLWAARSISGLTRAARRALAREIHWTQRETSWPGWFQRWLYTGDWLAAPVHFRDERYAALFLDHDLPGRDKERDAVWQNLWRQGPGGRFETGLAHCDCFRVPHWPDWAERLPAGADAAELRRLDAGGQWLNDLAGHATRRTGETADSEDGSWRFWFLAAGEGKKALLATWRPPVRRPAKRKDAARPAAKPNRKSNRRIA